MSAAGKLPGAAAEQRTTGNTSSRYKGLSPGFSPSSAISRTRPLFTLSVNRGACVSIIFISCDRRVHKLPT